MLDLHWRPGCINRFDICKALEALEHNNWWNSETALYYSYKTVDTIIDFIQKFSHSTSYNLEPINEPEDSSSLSKIG